jgi:hypothetical protein
LSQASVLIVSDDTDFARAVVARWQAERHVPEITLATSDLWHPSSGIGHDLVIVGPVRDGNSASILASLDADPTTAVVCVASDEKAAAEQRGRHPHAVAVPKRDGWTETLIQLAGEALRRVDAVNRAQRAERVAQESQRNATLGRYMLEMRPGVNDALTSVIGNADLLLFDPGQLSAECREQIRTIHAMALRLNEVMQRFSSLAAEMRVGETQSQVETELVSHRYVVEP